jgi:NitT/TauT family transport system permease protein
MAMSRRTLRRILPYAGVAFFILVWGLQTGPMGTTLVPGPWAVLLAIGELAANGTLWKHAVASLFRVTWGFGLGAVVGIPIGLALGWFPRAERALNPFVQILRPISPLAWTPIAILIFGVGDVPAIFIIFLGTLLPVIVMAMNAVGSVDNVHVNVARNFGLTPWQIIRRIVLPSAWPQLVTGLRLTLGIAWLVVVAAEMLAVTSGLGFLIIDSRNAGDRYDIVVAGMVLIGVTGLALDTFMRRLSSGVRQAAPVAAGH